jgi:hypothetical protein
MAWIVTIILALVSAILIALYRRGLKESQYLTALLIMVLIDDATYKVQKNGIYALVKGMQVRDALDLSTKVQLSVSNLAHRASDSTMLSSHRLLWAMKQSA